MTNPAQFVSDSIEATLVAIAEGVRDAQEALNAIPAMDSFGRALPTYHLPYLDFTIAVSVSTQQTSDGRAFIRLLPGDPITVMAGERGVSPERYQELMVQLIMAHTI